MKPLVLITLLMAPTPIPARERVLTTTPTGHQIHHCQVFSPDGRFIYYDARNDETMLAASCLIGRVELATGQEQILYQVTNAAPHGPGVGGVTCDPVNGRLAFIHGLANASAAEPYAPHRRCGMSLDANGKIIHLDARDLTEPITPGALRGGTHAFHWAPDGNRLSFTYNDAMAPLRPAPYDLRTVGVMTPGHPVGVAAATPGTEFSGDAFATLLVPVTPTPTPGSDELLRAFDEGWLDPGHLAFFGILRTASGTDLTEVMLAEVPPDPGVTTFRSAALPEPPHGITIRRLTHTDQRRYPGVQGPRHWVRPAPDGSLVAFLAKDDRGIVQIFAVAPAGGELRQLSRLEVSVASPFAWSPDSKFLACAAGGCVQLIEAVSGQARALTEPGPPDQAPRYSVCFSPTGNRVAYNRLLPHPAGGSFLQVVVCDLP